MTDGRAYDDQGLPWLEAVDDEDGPSGISGRKMFVALVMVLIAGAVVAGTFFWLGRRDPAVVGEPQLIAAVPGPYKVKPDDPGGLDVTGESETAYSTSAGEDPDAALDIGKMPATERPPVPPPLPGAATPPPPPKKIPPNETKEPAPDTAAAPAAGPTVQLGAYASTIKADTAWGMLSARFPEVAALKKTVVGATVGGKSIIRLRAVGSGEQIRAACTALKAAGESCLLVN